MGRPRLALGRLISIGQADRRPTEPVGKSGKSFRSTLVERIQCRVRDTNRTQQALTGAS
jgi:hypothetical protein